MIRRLLFSARFALARHRHAQPFTVPDGPRAFLFLAADYGNLGDVAITVAQREFLRVMLPSLSVVVVPISQTVIAIDSIRAQIQPEDLVTIIGGGNMGSLYPDIEALRRLVIRTFKNQRIITFPQSIDLGSKTGNARAVGRFLKPYLRHRRLTMCIRETRSLNVVAPHWPDKSRLLHVPDIVLSLATAERGGERGDSAVLSLRKDHERCRPSDADGAIRDAAERAGLTITEQDSETGVRYDSLGEAEAALRGHMDVYRKAAVVITDRLHGMILAERSGAAVVAFDNSNRKVSATHSDWLSDREDIALVEDSSGLDDALRRVAVAVEPASRLGPWSDAFAPLRAVLGVG